jgi:regulator of protease activity HflC (stomatin/prohibitin superfamily)
MKKLSLVSLMLAGLFLGGCTTIAPGHVGIMVNKYGSNRGVSDYTTSTGFVAYNPISTSVVEYPTFTQTIQWTASPINGEPGDESITFTTKEGVKVNVDVSLSYQLLADKTPSFYVKFRNDDINGFTYGYLHNVARNTMNEVGGNYTVEQIMGGDAAYINAVETGIQDQVKDIGVVISQFGFIGAPRPPANILESINQAQQAKYNAIRTQNELASTQAEVAKQVAAAEGQAKANRILSDSITENLLKQRQLDIQDRWINRWNGVTPTVSSGTNGTLLNLPIKP